MSARQEKSLLISIFIAVFLLAILLFTMMLTYDMKEREVKETMFRKEYTPQPNNDIPRVEILLKE